MGKLADSLDILINCFTMRNERHNRALSRIIDLSEYIEEFLAKYRLQEKGSDFRVIFENIAQARLDVITIMYWTRTRIKMSKDVKDKDLPPLLEEVHDDLQEVSRALLTPTLTSTVLGERLFKLHESFNKLCGAISGIEYK